MKEFEVKCIIKVPDYYDEDECQMIFNRIIMLGWQNEEIKDYEIKDCVEIKT